MNYNVSIIIPTIGGRTSIVSAIESVISQKNVKAEIIVVFDHIPIDLELKKKYNDIIFLQNKGNKGGNACRNLGVSVSKNDFIAFLDDDDTWQSDKLIKQLNVLSNYTNHTLIYTGKNIITKSIKKTQTRYNFSKQEKPSAKDSLSIQNFIGSTSSILLKRSTFYEVSGFNEGLSALQDYELYIRLATKGVYFVGIDEPLLNYYIVQNNFSVSKKISKNFKSSIQLLKLFKTPRNRFNFIINTVILYNIKVLVHQLRFI